MVKKTFTIATGSVDSEGDILPANIFTMPDKALRIFDHFDSSKQLGNVTDLKIVGNDAIMTAMFSEDPTGLYPAIGFTGIKWHDNAHGGRTYDEIKSWCVGVSPAPNADPNIKPIQ